MKKRLDLLKECHPEAGLLAKSRNFFERAPGLLTQMLRNANSLNICSYPRLSAFNFFTYSIKLWIRQARLRYHDIIIVFLFFFLLSCGNKLPEEILPGEHKCEFCKMGVVNENYHSQILTKKGRRFHFDSIECMFSYWNKNSDKIDKIWVKDYQHPKEWIEIQNARFLKADNLPSPMAANLSSYKTQKEAEDNRVLYGGKLMTQEEVMEYVKTNWEKELAGKGK